MKWPWLSALTGTSLDGIRLGADPFGRCLQVEKAEDKVKALVVKKANIDDIEKARDEVEALERDEKKASKETKKIVGKVRGNRPIAAACRKGGTNRVG